MVKKVLLMPGHSVWDSGAVNQKLNLTEFGIVRETAMKVFCMDDDETIDIVLKSRNKSYEAHVGEVNAWNADYVIELHLNAAGPDAQGCEVLYWNSSERGKKMADIMEKHLVKNLGYRDRGATPKKDGDRGSLLLKNTKAPCIIVEGYFLSGITDTKQVNIDKYAKAVRDAIGEICKAGI